MYSVYDIDVVRGGSRISVGEGSNLQQGEGAKI